MRCWVPAVVDASSDHEAHAEALRRLALKDGIEAISTGAAILRKGQALVLIRADSTRFMPGLGDLPGGYLAGGETVFAGLRREVAEETGLATRSIGPYLGHFDFRSGRGLLIRQLNFIVVVGGGAITLNRSEHKDFDWCPLDAPERMRALGLSPEARKVLDDARQAVEADGAPGA